MHVSPYNATSGPKGALVGRASEFFGVLMCQKRFLRGTPATFSARSSCTLLFLSSRTTLGATLGRARMTYQYNDRWVWAPPPFGCVMSGIDFCKSKVSCLPCKTSSTRQKPSTRTRAHMRSRLGWLAKWRRSRRLGLARRRRRGWRWWWPVMNVPKVPQLHSSGGRVGGSQLLTPLAWRLRSSGGRVGGSQLHTPQVHLVRVMVGFTK